MFECSQCAHAQCWPLPARLDRCPRCGRLFRAEEGILLLGAGDVRDDYPESAHGLIFAVEDRHFWFRGRARIILAALRTVLGGLRGLTALDVGCGSALVTAHLEGAGLQPTGLDTHLSALRLARRRTAAPLICSDAGRIPFRDEFDVTLLCDVLEHVEDEAGLLRECGAATKPGGVLLLTVPAGMWLWSGADEVAGHKRRYSRSALRELLRRAGFRIEFLRYFNSLTAPLLYLRRRLSSTRTPRNEADIKSFLAAELKPPPFPLNQMFLGALFAEALCLPLLGLPCGASLIAVARKPHTVR